MNEAVLIRTGEIFLKGGNRSYFESRLIANIKRALARLPGVSVEKLHHRLLIWPGEAGAAKVMRALEQVFGIVSLSPARVVERELEAITAAAVEVAKKVHGKPSFKVESRRADKRFQPASPEISRHVGAAIVAAHGLPVDVHHPALTIGVEVGFEHAFVFGEDVAGPGGLPAGVSGTVELLLSGGIDSPVAGWLMQKRGCRVNATYFHSFPYTGDQTKEKVATLARKLAAWQQHDLTLRVVPFTAAQKALREADPDGRLAVVLYRRMMMRVASRLGRAAGASALITGEALAQVASQTLDNMTLIGEAATLPVLRPCVGHDKQETIAIARRIGTFETSTLPYDDCCSLFVPEHPETHARTGPVAAAESRVDLEALISACVEGVELLRLEH
jgi:tRNA uracil 4-sulfurtransferase